MKKIFHVTVKNRYYCVADSGFEAKNMVDQAIMDFYDWDLYAREVTDTREIPQEHLHGLTYGADEDITLKDWIAAQEKEKAEQKKQEELDARQLKLDL